MRRLTVSTLRRQWGSMYRMRSDIVPALRLNGHWLAAAGFKPGEQVTVAVSERSLTITLTEEREQ